MNQLDLKINFQNIHEIIEEKTANQLENFNISLFNGLMGLALYYFFLAKHSKISCRNSYEKKGQEALAIIFDRLNNWSFKLTNPYSLCSGLTGVIYGMNFLAQKGYLPQNQIEELDNLKAILLRLGLKDFKNGNSDYLHGPMGPFWNLLQKENINENQKELTQLLNQYEATAIIDDFGLRIINNVTEGQEEFEYNLGLSHGLSGHLMILAEAYEKGFAKEKIKFLIEKGLDYLFYFQSRRTSTWESYFPTSCIEENGEPKRLRFANRVAWCYGDVNFAFLFLKLGRVFSNEEWTNLGIEIALKTIPLNTLETAKIKDPFICHGTVGAAYIYHKFYELTNIPDFQQAKNHWLAQTGIFQSEKLTNSEFMDKYTLSILEGHLGLALGLFCLERGLSFDFEEILLF